MVLADRSHRDPRLARRPTMPTSRWYCLSQVRLPTGLGLAFSSCGSQRISSLRRGRVSLERNEQRLHEAAIEFWGLPTTQVIYCAVDSRPVRPTIKEQLLVVFAGRVIPEKGLDILLDAGKLVNTFRLLVAGDGVQKNFLKHQAGPNVDFAEHLSRAVIDPRFNPAWVQVISSAWEEPFDVAAAEAQMRGTVVIASDSGALPEVITADRTGLIFPSGNLPPLALELNQLLSDRYMRLAFCRRISFDTGRALCCFGTNAR